LKCFAEIWTTSCGETFSERVSKYDIYCTEIIVAKYRDSECYYVKWEEIMKLKKLPPLEEDPLGKS